MISEERAIERVVIVETTRAITLSLDMKDFPSPPSKEGFAWAMTCLVPGLSELDNIQV